MLHMPSLLFSGSQTEIVGKQLNCVGVYLDSFMWKIQQLFSCSLFVPCVMETIRSAADFVCARSSSAIEIRISFVFFEKGVGDWPIWHMVTCRTTKGYGHRRVTGKLFCSELICASRADARASKQSLTSAHEGGH